MYVLFKYPCILKRLISQAPWNILCTFKVHYSNEADWDISDKYPLHCLFKCDALNDWRHRRMTSLYPLKCYIFRHWNVIRVSEVLTFLVSRDNILLVAFEFFNYLEYMRLYQDFSKMSPQLFSFCTKYHKTRHWPLCINKWDRENLKPLYRHFHNYLMSKICYILI